MFDQCIRCSRFGVGCSGQNFLCLSSSEFCSWLRAYKQHHRLTNAALAERVDAPLSTVARLLSGSTVSYDTAQQVMSHLAKPTGVGDSCQFSGEDDLQQALDRVSQLESELAAAHALALSESERQRAESERQSAEISRVVQTSFRYRSALVTVSAAFIAVLVSIILILAYDLSHPEMGWFSVHQGGSELFFVFVLCAVVVVLLTVAVVLGVQRLANKNRR